MYSTLPDWLESYNLNSSKLKAAVGLKKVANDKTETLLISTIYSERYARWTESQCCITDKVSKTIKNH